MGDTEKIIRAVESSMKMEGLPLSDEDKKRIETCLTDPDNFDEILRALIGKYTMHSAGQSHVRKV